MSTIPIEPHEAHRVYEGLVAMLYRAELRPGDGFIDLGANIGHHTWQMALAVGEQGLGLAVEPVPEFAERVRKVLANKSIDWVEIAETAVSDFDGETSFFVQPEHIGWSSMFADHVHPADAADSSVEITVPVRRLDRIVEEHPVPSTRVVKVDIENAEFAALRGASGLLSNDRPMVIFENNPRAAARRAGYRVEDFFAFFRDLEFALFSILLDPIVSAQQWEATPLSYYVALPAEHAAVGDAAAYYDVQRAAHELIRPTE